MDKAHGTINFIAPEIFRKAQIIANRITEEARGMDFIQGDDAFTARTVMYEIMRICVPHDCEHSVFKKYNKRLYACRGCYGLFKYNPKTQQYAGPIDLLALYGQLQEMTRAKKALAKMEEEARTENRMKVLPLDIQHLTELVRSGRTDLQPQLDKLLAEQSSLIGAERHG